MLNSIKKYSKTFFFKVLVGIIILPFLFWGMGDVFSGGSQNVVAKIDSDKVSSRDFINYLNVLNLSEQERKNLSKTDLINRILSDYIGKKVLALELQDLNVLLEDTSLKEIILNDKTFFKDNKFSRTEYEKFLISNSLSAPLFENNIAEQEKKRQLLSYLSGGIEIPKFLVQYEFNKENQTKKVEFINLQKFYNKPVSEKRIGEIYNKNLSFYSETFKDFKFAELTPSNIVGENEYSENFFNKINQIENKILDGIEFEKITSDYNLSINNTGLVNIEGNTKIGKELVQNFFKLKKENTPEFLNIDKKYYIVELTKISQIQKEKNNKDVRESIIAQIKIENKITENSKLAKEISTKKFTRSEMDAFAKKNSLVIESTTLTKIKDNQTFSPGIVKRIFETDDKSLNLITDNMLKDNFIIYVKETKLPKIKKENEDFDNFKLKAKLRLANDIYNIYDLNLNRKYNVEINNKTLNRIKNSF
ncbi:MAG: hypothetical protein CMI78_00265 [Candidatus Pelagibacter sp.]|nr:hypothetical protein [Candidatus Pelagibacter sp.]